MVAANEYGGARKFIFGTYLDEPLALIDVDTSENIYYYHQNRLYNVAAMTDSSGNVVERYTFSAYGLPLILTGAGTDGTWGTTDDVTATASAIGNPYLYTGQRWDPETENHYYKNRYQRPTLGRFISRDSQGYVDGMNEYEYVRSHPNWYLDPVGLAAWQATEGAYKDQDAKKRKAMRTKMKTCIVEKAKDALENKEKSDCADTAIKSIIECAKKLGYPLQFKVWDAAKKEYKYISYKDYDSSGDFVKDAQAQMTATSLMDNTRPQKWSDLEGGDFMLYKLEGEQHQDYTGHTMIITGKNTDADKPTWTTVEGHMQGNPPTAGGVLPKT